MPMDRKELERAEAELEEAQNDSYRRKDESGFFKNVFKDDTKIKNFLRCKEGDHEIAIIPFQAGKNHPKVAEGKWTYVIEFYVHQRIGPGNASVVCPIFSGTGKHCPICEHLEEMANQPRHDQKLYDALKPKRRVAYNVVCFDSIEEEKKGVQVLELAHWFSERHIVGIAARGRGRAGGKIIFSGLTKYYPVLFTRKGSGQKNTSYEAFAFGDQQEMPEEYLEKAYILDEEIHWHSYNELKELFLFGSGEEEEAKKPESSSRRSERKEEIKEEIKEETQEETQEEAQEETVPDEKEAEPEVTTKSGTECPFIENAVMGVDFEEFDECTEKCNQKTYIKCSQMKDELKKEEEEKSKPKSTGTRRRGK